MMTEATLCRSVEKKYFRFVLEDTLSLHQPFPLTLTSHSHFWDVPRTSTECLKYLIVRCNLVSVCCVSVQALS